MTGNELKELLTLYGLSQKKAAAIFEVTPVTMSNQVKRGEADISKRLHEKVVKYAIDRETESLHDAASKLTKLYDEALNTLGSN